MEPATQVINLAGDPIYARVRDQLRQEILGGVFAAGARLKIADLAGRYGVSQMPVREALQQLQGEGLVLIEPNKGARVRKVDEAFIVNVYEIFGALEGLLIRRATPLLSAADLRQSRAIEQAFEAAGKQGDLDGSLRQNQLFHHLLYQRAGNAEALEIIERHWGLIDCLRRKHGFGPRRIAAVIDEHRRLLRALEDHDAKTAESLVRDHCAHAREDLVEQMRE